MVLAECIDVQIQSAMVLGLLDGVAFLGLGALDLNVSTEHLWIVLVEIEPRRSPQK